MQHPFFYHYMLSILIEWVTGGGGWLKGVSCEFARSRRVSFSLKYGSLYLFCCELRPIFSYNMASVGPLCATRDGSYIRISRPGTCLISRRERVAQHNYMLLPCGAKSIVDISRCATAKPMMARYANILRGRLVSCIYFR